MADGPLKHGADTIEVCVCWVPAHGLAQQRTLHLAPGTSLGDAVHLSGLDLPDASWRDAAGDLRLAVFGALKPASVLAQAGDRIDITRPLTVDPKEARRLRARKAAALRRAARA